jgi:FKBP-type peptidyl-prolyl cis-trans isomerase (trigger factor)
MEEDRFLPEIVEALKGMRAGEAKEVQVQVRQRAYGGLARQESRPNT